MNQTVRFPFATALLAFILATGSPLYSGQLYVGAATTSITPQERVALDGQFHLRVSQNVESPCAATALALETRNGDESLEQAIFISCDLVGITGGIKFYDELRAKLKGTIPDGLLHKIVLNATHTHTGPVTEPGKYPIPESGVMQAEEYRDFLMQQLATVAAQAWNQRGPGEVAWGLGEAVIAQNRRSTYANGSSVMYGNTNDPNFRGIEGTTDHGVEILYFWNAQHQLIASAINVACPSQEVEGRSAVNADFWHQVREQLRKEHGDQLHILGWCGAAGDQSPHYIYRKAAEERMQKLRGLDGLNELARRIVATWDDVLQVVKKDRHSDVQFSHYTEVINLPPRKITQAEADASRVAADGVTDPNQARRKLWFEEVLKRFEKQQAGTAPPFQMELHVIRLGDIVIATNDFELFTDYGVQIKARSPALQTFVIQLCGGGTYLPTERAVQGGGYSAIPQSNAVGPEGGQVLVEETIKAINQLWK